MSEVDASTRPDRRRSPWLWGALVAAAAAILGGGWLLATLFQSPAQQEANATAPSAAPIYAAVAAGTLARELVVTGQVETSSEVAVTFVPAADTTLSVVTGHPVPAGSTLAAGGLLTEVNGRPVFTVRSPFAFYRDLGIGDSGPDVTSLQNTLAALGYDVGADGSFGARTAAAVARWYSDNGYAPSVRTGAAVSDEAAIDEEEAPSAKGGFYLPLAEVVTVRSASFRTIRGVDVGTVVAADGRADLVLGEGDVVIRMSASASELGEVAEGDAVTISVDGADVEGTIGTIAFPDPADDETDGAQSDAASGAEPSSDATVTIIPAEPLLQSQPGDTVRVNVIGEVLAEGSLLVPVLAVIDRGGGDTVVTLLREDGTLAEVPVTVLASLNGQVAITAEPPDALDVGDEVRVG